MRTLSIQKLLTGVILIRSVNRFSRYSNGLVPTEPDRNTSDWRTTGQFSVPVSSWVDTRIKRSNQIPKPHITREGLDNSETPFVPSLRGGVKPNAIDCFRHDVTDHTSLDDTKLHPYYEELQAIDYPGTVFINREPENSGPLENHTYEFITTEERVDVLVGKLKEASEIAIDLEHHNYRSYLGFTCLIQISINGHDYIIDPLCVGHCLHKLLDPFTNPNIIKVFHGGDFDMQVLQRDFSLYLVGMFDTHQASIALDLPKKSLAFLLNYYCGVTASKKYQTADWRVRPLLPQMERYAREDTHYLLYIYQRMRNELIRRSTRDVQLVREVLEIGRKCCLRLYCKPMPGINPKWHQSLSPLQIEIAKELILWRDRTAREEDESNDYVLPSSMVYQIVYNMPEDKNGILACCNPIPPLLNSSIEEVALVIQRARSTFRNEPREIRTN